MAEKNKVWEALLPIIATQGIEVAHAIWQRWSAGGDPTDEDWLVLLRMAHKSPEDLARAAATAAGIPLDDAKFQQILTLLAPPPLMQGEGPPVPGSP